MAEYAEHIDPSDSKPGCHEPSANPGTDGGRLVFLIIELIRGKRIDPEKEGMVHFVGLMLLMLLMVVVMFNDVRKIFF